MEEIVQGDRELLLYLNNLGDTPFDQFWILISEKWIWIPLYVIFLYFLYKNFKLKSVLYILLFVVIGITVSDQVSGIFKYGVARLRPCNDPGLQPFMRIVKCGGPFGFYSAHASNTFFLASYLGLLLKNKIKWFPYFIVFWAAVVSYSRVYLGVHFPLDIFVGAFAGSLFGWVFYLIVKKIIAKHQTA